jgi:hypothetical protein
MGLNNILEYKISRPMKTQSSKIKCKTMRLSKPTQSISIHLLLRKINNKQMLSLRAV